MSHPNARCSRCMERPCTCTSRLDHLLLEDPCLLPGERDTLLRACRFYMHDYQVMLGKEKDPLHKQSLRDHIKAAAAIHDKLKALRKRSAT